MRADRRRSAAVQQALAVEGEGEGRQLQVGNGRVRDVLQHAERLRLRGVGDVGHVGNGCCRHARRCQPRVPDSRVVGLQPLGQQVAQLVAVAGRGAGWCGSAGRRRAPAGRRRRRSRQTGGRCLLPASACRRAWGRPDTAPPWGSASPRRVAPCRPPGSRRGGSRCSRAPSRTARRRRPIPRPCGRARSARPARRAPPRCRCPGRSRTTPTRTPGRPGSPVTEMSPPAACISASYPGSAGERANVAVRTHGAVDETRVPGPDGFRAEPECLGEARPQALQQHVGAVRRAAGAPPGRARRAARRRASACRRSPRGTSCPRRSRTAAPRRARRRPCRAAPP